MMYQQLVKTYSEFVTSRKVSEHTIKAFKLKIDPIELHY